MVFAQVVWEWTMWLWPILSVVGHVALALVVSAHVVIHKYDTRGAFAWFGMVWLAPIVGSLLYITFGINRVERRAARLRPGGPRRRGPRRHQPPSTDRVEIEADLGEIAPLKLYVDRVCGADEPLTHGNAVKLLCNGDDAYPAMLAAIDQARTTVGLCSYIFAADAWGQRFIDALGRAAERGVAVRVLVDGLGSLTSSGRVLRRLRRRGVRAERFLWSYTPWHMSLLNLRNHRKVLVIDGKVGFTGGMNIKGDNVHAEHPRPQHDLHFRVDGPVVAQLAELFAVDWNFAAGERLEGDGWFPDIEDAGQMMARVIPDGPDEDLLKAEQTFRAALSCARHHVRIATPYFLPEDAMIAVIATSSMRGVDVEVLVPARNVPVWFNWAMMGDVRKVLAHKTRVILTGPLFDHSKVIVVDGRWTLLGSPNWDARSLRLNFEMGLEVYSEALAAEVVAALDRRRATGRRLTFDDVAARPWAIQLRDGLARLLKPYL